MRQWKFRPRLVLVALAAGAIPVLAACAGSSDGGGIADVDTGQQQEGETGQAQQAAGFPNPGISIERARRCLQGEAHGRAWYVDTNGTGHRFYVRASWGQGYASVKKIFAGSNTGKIGMSWKIGGRVRHFAPSDCR